MLGPRKGPQRGKVRLGGLKGHLVRRQMDTRGRLKFSDNGRGWDGEQKHTGGSGAEKRETDRQTDRQADRQRENKKKDYS